MYVLGIHQGHDSNVTLVKDGKIIASVSEEKFTRIKHSASTPYRGLNWILKEVGITIKDLDLIVFPSVEKYDQIEVLLGLQKKGFYIKDNPEIKKNIYDHIRLLAVKLLRLLNLWIPLENPVYIPKIPVSGKTKILHVEHHLAHAATAYYTCGFQKKTLVVTSDGSGDGLSVTVFVGEQGKLAQRAKFGRESSLGAFYGLVTEALGWWIGDGEGKTMGLAPYGSTKRTKGVLDEFSPQFKNGQLKKGYNWGLAGVWEDMGTFHYHHKDAQKVQKLIKKYGRENIAAEAQRVLEQQLINIINAWVKNEKVDNLALSGGVFLNVKANQRIWEEGLVKNLYIYPDAGDAGLSAGAALHGYFLKNPQKYKFTKQLENVYFGPSYKTDEIEKILKTRKIIYDKFPRQEIVKRMANLLAENKIVAIFNKRIETGPRALGNRSILMSPLKAENKDIINNTIKYRESFRPFCPTILDSASKTYLKNPSPNSNFMIISYDVPDEVKNKIPAVVHVDGTVRPQVLKRKNNPFFYDLIEEFGRITGVPVLLNTSLNIRGESIVCSPQDALKCFYDTGIDYLIFEEQILLSK